MKALLKLCDIGVPVPVTGRPMEAAWEQFVSIPRITAPCFLTDGHHGDPLAEITRTWHDDRSLYAEAEIIPVTAAETALTRAATAGTGISLEFTSTKELRPNVTLDGRSVLMHRTTTIHGVALAPSPARTDGHLTTILGRPTEPRQKPPGPTRMPIQVRARYFHLDGTPKTVHSGPVGTIIR